MDVSICSVGGQGDTQNFLKRHEHGPKVVPRAAAAYGRQLKMNFDIEKICFV